MSLLEEFRSFDINRSDVEDLVQLSLYGRQLASEYAALNIEAPEWIDDNLKIIRRELHARLQDTREARLKEIEARIAALETPEEKRKKLQAEAERLRAASA